jgi:hypothetical protein
MSVVPQTSYLGSWAACFQGGLSSPASNLRRTVLGICMQMMQQLTGLNFILSTCSRPLLPSSWLRRLDVVLY